MIIDSTEQENIIARWESQLSLIAEFSEDLKAAYSLEIDKFDFATWTAPKRAGRLSGAVRRYKNTQMLNALIDLLKTELDASGELPDVTPLMARRLCQGLWQQTGSQRNIVYIFGQKGRVSKNADDINEYVEAFVERHSTRAKALLEHVPVEIESVKSWYSQNHRVYNQ